MPTRRGPRCSFGLSKFLDDLDDGPLMFRMVTMSGAVDLPIAARRVKELGWPVLTLAQALEAGAPPRRLRAGRGASVNRGRAPPYGYQLMGGFTVDHPEQAAVVTWVFDRALTVGTRIIAGELNALGVASASRRSWSKQAVQAVLENRFYLGEPHDPIISERQFEKVQRALKRRRKRGRK